MKDKQKDTKIVLYPPKIIIVKNDKYELILDIEWGEYSTRKSINKEHFGYAATIELLNEGLLELSEKEPYEIIS